MSLKDKINETKTIKPKIETELNKINSVITGGGGIVSNTLADIPNSITNIINQNKRISIINGPYSFTCSNKLENDVEKFISCNFGFKPSKILITIQGNTASLTISSDFYSIGNKDFIIIPEHAVSFRFKPNSFTSNGFTLIYDHRGQSDTVTILQIIAIE